MTAILSAVFRGCLFQVSDRLTTTVPGQRHWDPEANKSLIVHLGGAPTLVGFSGSAYLKGIPTDTWLAATICDLPWASAESLAPHRPTALAGVSVRGLVTRIADGLREHVKGLTRREPVPDLDVQIAYLLRPRPHRQPRARGGVAKVRCAGGVITVAHRPVPASTWARRPGAPASPFLDLIPDYGAAGRAMLADLAEQAMSSEGPEDFVGLLRQGILKLAERHRTVGATVLSISLIPVAEPAFLIDYVPACADLAYPGPVSGVRGHFTPWYVSASGWMPPRLATPMEMGLEGDPRGMRVLGGSRTLPLMIGAQTHQRRPPP